MQTHLTELSLHALSFDFLISVLAILQFYPLRRMLGTQFQEEPVRLPK
jgi:hypothetical protein